VISLALPGSDERTYAMVEGGLIGPFDPKKLSQPSTMQLTSMFDSLDEIRGFYGENAVDHQKLEGTLIFSPLGSVSTSSPTANNPDQVKMTSYHNGNLTPEDVLFSMGIIRDGTVSFRKDSTYIYQYAWDLISPYNITVYELQARVSSPTQLWSIAKKTLSLDYCSYGYAYWKADLKTISLPFGYRSTSINWSSRQAYQTVVSYYYGTELTSNVKVLRTDTFVPVNEPICDPSLVSKQINDALLPYKMSDNYDSLMTAYGDIAVDALSQVDANNVNMWAFLRDLRHPTELIPKLKQLNKLKGWANNYLTVQYGILPTISDLKDIVAAFSRMKPYVDRNGFSTYSARAYKEKDFLEAKLSVEQHVKVAIDNCDSELATLVNRLSDLGFDPTFENLWDLVPYSFVIDWFIDVGGFLERIDTQMRLVRLNVKYSTLSSKLTAELNQLPSSLSMYTGTVKWVHYHRWPIDHCPEPPFSISTTFQNFNHWLESSALILQRAKKLKF